MKVIVSVALSLGVFLYSNILQSMPAASFYESVQPLNTEVSFHYNIIPAPNHTWGYDILRDNKIFIQQPNRPGLPGKEGFKTKKDAMKVAELVISKLKKGEMPPTVSLEELKALKVKL